MLNGKMAYPYDFFFKIDIIGINQVMYKNGRIALGSSAFPFNGTLESQNILLKAQHSINFFFGRGGDFIVFDFFLLFF